MRRRTFTTLVGGAATFWCMAALARPAGRLRRIGFLRASPPPGRLLAAFRRGLAEAGLVDGKDYVVVGSFGHGRFDRMTVLAEALVKSGVDVILVDGTGTAVAARRATTKIPIVMAGGRDPLHDHLAESLSRPGGNVTGFTTLVVELVGKTFEILKEIVPNLTRIAVVTPPGTGLPFHRFDAEAAKRLGLTVEYFDLSESDAGDAAIRAALRAGAQAGIARGTPYLSTAQRRALIERAAANRLPVMYETRDFVDLGGLISYGSDFDELFRLAAGYVVKILHGADPARLPIQQSTKIELLVNLKAAKALDLRIPASILARADEVIE